MHLSGFVAWFVWRGVYLFKLPTWARRLQVGFDWAWLLLFPRDLAQCLSQELGVLEAYARDGASPRLEDVGRVKSASQAHLEDPPVDPPGLAASHGKGGHQLKEARKSTRPLSLALLEDGQHGVDLHSEIVLWDGAAGDADSLPQVLHVRRQVGPGSESRLPEERLENQARSTLSLRPGNVDRRVAFLRVSQVGHERPHSLDAQRFLIVSEGRDALVVCELR